MKGKHMRKQSLIRGIVLTALVFGALLVGAPAARAQLFFHVRMDTSLLIGHPGAPFYLDFQLNGGSGVDMGNNRVTLSNFDFGGGFAGPDVPNLIGGASGDLTGGLTISDTLFRNEFFQPFTPGSVLEFDAEITTNVDAGPTPDQFSFSILDCTQTEIPTLGTPTDVFVLIRLDSPSPLVQAFAGDPSRSPACGGGSIGVDSPAVTSGPSVEVVPEPATSAFFGIGFIGLFAHRRRRA